MPDPRKLKVGDRIRFVEIPDEWADPKFTVHEESVEFMKAMIARNRPSRVTSIDENGYPWIDARMLRKDGKLDFHSWGVFEKTGWKLVTPRA